jgi:hypothetical protein
MKKANTAYPAAGTVLDISRQGGEFSEGLKAFLEKRPPEFS